MHSSINKGGVVLVCLMFCIWVAAHPQQPKENSDPTSRGIVFFESGDIEGAISALRAATKKSKDDSKAWHYLGLALIRQGNLKEAREALGKATDLRLKIISPEFAPKAGEWRGDQITRIKTLLDDYIMSQSKLSEVLSDQPAIEKGLLALERARARADCVEQTTRVVDGQRVLTKSDMRIERARVLVKPEPIPTEEALRARTGGMVVLRAILSAEGAIKYIEPIQSAGYGLTEIVIKAAQGIKFKPESICGKPVSSPIQLEYNFSFGQR